MKLELSTYKNCVLFLAPLQSVDWMSLKKVPDWNNIVSIKCSRQQIRNAWKVLKCGAGEGWRRSVGPIM